MLWVGSGASTFPSGKTSEVRVSRFACCTAERCVIEIRERRGGKLSLSGQCELAVAVENCCCSNRLSSNQSVGEPLIEWWPVAVLSAGRDNGRTEKKKKEESWRTLWLLDTVFCLQESSSCNLTKNNFYSNSLVSVHSLWQVTTTTTTGEKQQQHKTNSLSNWPCLSCSISLLHLWATLQLQMGKTDFRCEGDELSPFLFSCWFVDGN